MKVELDLELKQKAVLVVGEFEMKVEVEVELRQKVVVGGGDLQMKLNQKVVSLADKRVFLVLMDFGLIWVWIEQLEVEVYMGLKLYLELEF